jgi:hypothetical protein
MIMSATVLDQPNEPRRERIAMDFDAKKPTRRNLLKAAGAGLLAVSFGSVSVGMAQTPDRPKSSRRAVPANIDAGHAGRFRIGGDLTVNRLGYGTLQLPGPHAWGEPVRRAEALSVLKRLPEIGVNFVDTADAYFPFVAEDLIAEAVSPYQGFPYEGLHIATKGGLVRPDPETDPWIDLGEPHYLQQCVRMSLRRLKLERASICGNYIASIRRYRRRPSSRRSSHLSTKASSGTRA